MYFLVLSVKKKALDEIYRLLHRSDLNISAKVGLLFGVLNFRNAKTFAIFQNSARFSLIL